MADKKVTHKTDKPKADSKTAKYFYGLGRRKKAIAKVKLFPKGSGKFTVNTKDYKQYFPQFSRQNKILCRKSI